MRRLQHDISCALADLRYVFALCGVMACCLSSAVYAADPRVISDDSSVKETHVIHLTAPNWPPYTSELLPDQGVSAHIAKAAFSAMGYQLIVDFMPWTEAVDSARNNPIYDGYFPEYMSDSITKEWIPTEPIGAGPLVLVEQKSAPVTWHQLSDLWPKRIGVVSGYLNTDAIDTDIANQRFQHLSAFIDDAANLRKLARGQLDAIIIDANVFRYLMAHDPTLMPYAHSLQVNQHIFDIKKLYICFRHTARGAMLAAVFNEGIKKIDVNAIMRAHIKETHGSSSLRTPSAEPR